MGVFLFDTIAVMLKILKRDWERFEYKHTSMTIIIMLLTLLILNTALATAVLEWFKNVGLLGGFVGGIMSVSMFTTAPAIVLILAIADHVNPWLLILAASAGSVVGDWLIIKFLEDEVASELKPLLKKYHILPKIRKFQRSKSRWIASVLGAFVLALPLPDEFGIALMDISNMKRKHLLLVCFVLNLIGIAALVGVGSTLVHI